MKNSNSVSPETFKRLMVELDDACSWGVTEKNIRAWWKLFKRVPEDILVKAFKFALKDIKFKPMPSHIYDGLTKAGYVPPVHIKTTGMINRQDVEPLKFLYVEIEGNK